MFAPKYRRKEIYGTMRREIGMILRELCKRKEVSRPYTHVCKYTTQIERIIVHGISERKSTLIIFERHVNLRYKYGNRTLCCRGFYVSTIGNNKSAVYNYVENQLEEDMMTDQITIKEYKGHFKGE